jgi:hypothetical protein
VQSFCFTAILIIIPVKFVDSNSSIHKTNIQHNGTVFTKFKARTLEILDKSTSETPGTQLLMLTNISVKFITVG